MPWIVTTTLTVFAPLVLIYWYLGKKLLNAVALATTWKRQRIRRAVFGVITYVNLFPLVFLIVFLLGGRTRVPAFSGESLLIDILLVYPFWFSLVIAIQLFCLLILTDVAKVLAFPIFRRRKEAWLKGQSKIVVFAVLGVSIYSMFAIIKDTWTVRITEKEFRLPAQAAPLEGVTLVHIADVQGDGRTTVAKLERYVQKINDLKPDAVLFAGDLVTSGEDYIRSSAEILGRIDARYGMIAAVGDHDIFSNKAKIFEEMRMNGFLIADDTSMTIDIRDVPVTVTLLTHTYRQRPQGGDLERATNGANGKLKILLVHQPAESLVEFARERNYDIFLAGHTHGGGIAFGIPGLFLFAPASLESPYVSGFYQTGSMLVSVTNGLGMTLTPIRFHAPAEISVIRLVS